MTQQAGFPEALVPDDLIQQMGKAALRYTSQNSQRVPSSGPKRLNLPSVELLGGPACHQAASPWGISGASTFGICSVAVKVSDRVTLTSPADAEEERTGGGECVCHEAAPLLWKEITLN